MSSIVRDHISDIRVLEPVNDNYETARYMKPEEYITPNVASNRHALNSARETLQKIKESTEYAELRKNREYKLFLAEAIRIADKLIADPNSLNGKDMVDLISHLNLLVSARQLVDNWKNQKDRKGAVEWVGENLADKYENLFINIFSFHSEYTESNFSIPIIFVFDRFMGLRDLMYARTAGVALKTVMSKNNNEVDLNKGMDSNYVTVHDNAHYSRAFKADMEVLAGSKRDIQVFRRKSVAYLDELLATIDRDFASNPALKKAVETTLFHAMFDSNEPASFPLGIPKFIKYTSDNLIERLYKGQYGPKTRALLGENLDAINENIELGHDWLKAYFKSHPMTGI